MSITKIKRECLHPAEIPPDPKEKRTAEQKVETFFVFSFLVVVPILFLTMFMFVAYDSGERKGYREGRTIYYQQQNLIRDCKIYGTENDCEKPYRGLFAGDDETFRRGRGETW